MAVVEPLQNQKHVFELGSGKVCFDGLCPKVNALLSGNVWVLVTVRVSKQTQPQGSIEIVPWLSEPISVSAHLLISLEGRVKGQPEASE